MLAEDEGDISFESNQAPFSFPNISNTSIQHSITKVKRISTQITAISTIAPHSAPRPCTALANMKSVFRVAPIQFRLRCHSQISPMCRNYVWCLDSVICLDLSFPDVSTMLLLAFFILFCFAYTRSDCKGILFQLSPEQTSPFSSPSCVYKSCLLPGWLRIN